MRCINLRWHWDWHWPPSVPTPPGY